MTVTISLSPGVEAKLREKAASSGQDLSSYIASVVERNAQEPVSLEEISGPMHQRFIDSKMTEEELGDLLEQEKHAARWERKAHRDTGV